MPGLDTTPKLADPDALYQALIDSHTGRDPAASLRLGYKTILILANHIGDATVVRQALDLAQASETAAAT